VEISQVICQDCGTEFQVRTDNYVPILMSLFCVAAVTAFPASAPAQRIDPPFRQDLVGSVVPSTLNFLRVMISGRVTFVDIEEATIVLRSDITDCDPRRPFTNCPLTIERLYIRVGSFDFGRVRVRELDIRNEEPISISGLSRSIPPGAPFRIRIEYHQNRDVSAVGTFSSRGSAIENNSSIVVFFPGSPPGNTRTEIALGLDLSGTLDNRRVTLEAHVGFQVVNQLPIARASSSQSFDPATCTPTVVLDASETTDPDDNLSSLRWFDDNGTFVGEGPTIEIPVEEGRPEFGFLLVAEDDIGAAATARTTITPEPAVCIISVPIDIEPSELPNLIHISNDPNRIRVTTVAILTSPTFDATTVDATTVRFGKTGAEAAPVQAVLADANGDGMQDYVFRFYTRDTGLQCGDTSAVLTGMTLMGRDIMGSDEIVTVRGGATCP
jgi:hypothetical protein